MNTFQIGDKIIFSHYLGKITEIQGGSFIFTTPHGSSFLVGFVWTKPMTDPQDLIMLDKYEKDAASKGVFYNTFLDYQI